MLLAKSLAAQIETNWLQDTIFNCVEKNLVNKVSQSSSFGLERLFLGSFQNVIYRMTGNEFNVRRWVS